MGMLLGSLFGIQVGALVTKLVPGIYIRGFYALAILSGFVNRLFAMPGKLGDMKLIAISPVWPRCWPRWVTGFFSWSSAFSRFGSSARSCSDSNCCGKDDAMLLYNPKVFYRGAALGVVFAVVLYFMFTPSFGGKDAFHASDNLFNSISKGSTYHIPQIMEGIKPFEGRAFSVTIFRDESKYIPFASVILSGNGLKLASDGKGLACPAISASS